MSEKSPRIKIIDEFKTFKKMFDDSLAKGFKSYMSKFYHCEGCTNKWNPETMKTYNVKQPGGKLLEQMLCNKCSSQLEAAGSLRWICCDNLFGVKTDYYQHQDYHHARGE